MPRKVERDIASGKLQEHWRTCPKCRSKSQSAEIPDIGGIEIDLLCPVGRRLLAEANYWRVAPSRNARRGRGPRQRPPGGF
jgi:hypothetical protein